MSEYKVGITFNAKTGQFKSDVKQVDNAIEKIGVEVTKTTNKVKPFNASLDNTGFKLAKTNKVAVAVSQAINGFGKSTQRTANKTSKLAAEVNNSKAKLVKNNKVTLTTSKAVNALASRTQSAASKNRILATSLDNTNAKLITTNKVARSVGRAIAGMAAGFGALQLGSGLVKQLAEFQDIRTRLQGLSVDAADYADKEQWLISLATEHHKELNGLADGYSRLSALTKENIITDKQARDMLEGLSNAASSNGAGTEDLQRVYYGLGQALGAGTVNMEDFKQVTEPLPDLMNKIARAAGQKTSAGLKKLIASGKLTSQVFGQYLVTALQDYDGASAKTANNINAKYRDIKREYTLLAKELEQPINSALLPTLDGLSEGLGYLKEHTESVITVLEIGLVVAAGHAVSAITNKTATTIKSTLASRAAAQTALIQAKAEFDLATVLKASAISENQNIAADIRLANSRVALTAATRAASLAQKGLGLAMAFLGGPVGVAMLAAWAITSFAMSAADAARESVNLADKVGLADKKLTELTTKQLRLRLFNIENDPAAEIDKARLLALKAQEEYDKVKAKRGFKNPNKFSEKKLKERDVEIEFLQAKFDQAKILKAQIKDLLKKPDTNGKPKNNAIQNKKALDVFAQQRDALKKQLSLLGKTNELAKAEYATTYGKYSKLLPAQKAEIIALAKTIDYKNKSNAADIVANNQAKQLAKTAQSYGASLQRKISLSGQITEVQRLNYEIENGSLQGINDKLRDQLLLKAQLADQAVIAADKQLPFWEQLKENIQQTTTNFDAMWGASFNNFAQGIGDATATAIVEGQNFGQTMKTIARSAIKEVISGLVQMGVKYIALEGIKRVIGKTGAVAAGGTMLAEAQASSLMAGINAFASTAAIPIVGPGLAPGAMTAALAITTPMVAGVAGMTATMVGMAHEGIDSIPREGTWLLDKGERIVDSRTNQDLKTFLNKAQGGGGSNIVLNYAPTLAPNTPEEFAQQLQDHSDHIYNLLREAKTDRAEEF